MSERVLIIDNYDSFTYNIVQLVGELGFQVHTIRNDAVGLNEFRQMDFSAIIISPGPGIPSKAGITVDTIRELGDSVPILGICLGHQAIAEAFGGRIIPSIHLLHGKTSLIQHDGKTIFRNIPSPMEAGRYHSLVVDKGRLPKCLEVSAVSDDGEVMGIRHKYYPIEGVQFHPESILTPAGKQLLQNFLNMSRYKSERPVCPGFTGSNQITAQHKQVLQPASEPGQVQTLVHKVLEGQKMSCEEAEYFMTQVMQGAVTPSQIAAVLAAIKVRGDTVEELTGFAKGIIRYAVKVTPKSKDLVDIVGTGGDKCKTFNISTAAAFVVAGAGVRVAKHGNRAVSGKCGSADVLEALGVKVDLNHYEVARCIDEVGVGFMFAPIYHGAIRHAAPTRKELATRTSFNLLGPLTNPARVKYQLVGVYDPELTELMASVLAQLGLKRAIVVHGAGGLDEVSISGATKVTELKDGATCTYYIKPEDFGIDRALPQEIAGGSPEDNAQTILEVLRGKPGPKLDVVLINAAMALKAACVAESLEEALQLCRKSITSGAALSTLESLKALTNQFKEQQQSNSCREAE